MQTTVHDKKYAQYHQQFTKVFEAYRKVEPYLELPDHFKSFVLERTSWLDRLSSPEFPVAFLGSFNAGKSTVINAILGVNILPEMAKSTTAVPTIVKKGDKEVARVYYLDDKGKLELRNLYVQKIAEKGLHKGAKEIEELLQLPSQEILEKLRQDIKDAVANFKTPFSENKLWKELKKLIEDWDHSPSGYQDIVLSDIPRHVVESENSLFIDRVEVFLSQADLLEGGIVLVDLPGLGVVNPRHEKMTKSYVENNAKAFVIVMVGLHLLEGEEIEFLSKVHKQRPQVLEKAFWVINQWDIVKGGKQRDEVLKNFEEKVQQYGFNIAEQRRFEVAALPYLMVKLIVANRYDESGLNSQEGILSFMGGKPKTSTDADNSLKNVKEVRDFGRFKENLLNYLATTAKMEFLEEARQECFSLASKLLEQVEPFCQTKGRGGKEVLIDRETSRKADQALEQLNKIVGNAMKEIRQEIRDSSRALVSWGDKQRDLEREIKEAVDKLDKKDLLDAVQREQFISEVWGRLPREVEKQLSIARQFKEKLLSLAKENVIEQFSQKLYQGLVNSGSLPEAVLEMLNDKLGKRDMLSRIKGVCDVLLLKYSDTVEEYYRICYNDILAWKENKMPRNEIVEKALGLYQQTMITFVNGLHSQINEYFKMSVKNYFEELEGELLALFKDRAFDIQEFVKTKVASNIEGELGEELKKQEAIYEAYEMLTQVKSLCHQL